jgi:hypothetical protein
MDAAVTAAREAKIPNLAFGAPDLARVAIGRGLALEPMQRVHPGDLAENLEPVLANLARV